MDILIIGGGGREHALAWKLRQSPIVGQMFAAPGNAGLFTLAAQANIDIDKPEQVLEFCRGRGIGLVVIGPERPLTRGVADVLRAGKIAVFGPSAAAAQLEASKAFTKAICKEYAIPTAAYAHFTDSAHGLAYARARGAPLVVKADGLAGGKGVTVCETVAEAEAAITVCFSGEAGEVRASVVIEEKLEGEEASFFALCDGEDAIPFGSAQDYKRAYDGDTGPNTGGMGAVSPAPMMTPALEARVMEDIIKPTLRAMRDRGTPYRGVLYAGLMISPAGNPKLIEFNVRFGDPECQVLMLRLKSDLLPLLTASADGSVTGVSLDWNTATAVTVVVAAKGYPGKPLAGSMIGDLADAMAVSGAPIFHAGTSRAPDGELIATGGRVLNVCALRDTPADARRAAYEGVDAITWRESFCRRDIGWRSVTR